MLTIAIQAGGKSRRMGQDKALLPFLGKPLIARVLERVAAIADEVLVTTNRPDDYRFLGVPLFPDLIPGRGPLGGLYTALFSARFPLVAVLACDMPFVNSRLLSAQRDLLLGTNSDMVIPHTDTGLEPFHAVYLRQACMEPVEAALEKGKLRVDAWFGSVKLRRFPVEEIRKYDPQLLSFRNVNTPEDMRVAIHLARQIATSGEIDQSH